MDATTFTAIRLNEHRAADLDREVALLAAQKEHRAARGEVNPEPARRRFWRRTPARRPATPPCDSQGLVLAGPAS